MTNPTHAYTVYGECLASSIPFPELPERAPTDARWTFETIPRLAPMRAPRELGADLLYAAVHARLHAHEGGHRIVVDDTGSFDLSADRRHVRCAERPDAWPDFASPLSAPTTREATPSQVSRRPLPKYKTSRWLPAETSTRTLNIWLQPRSHRLPFLPTRPWLAS